MKIFKTLFLALAVAAAASQAQAEGLTWQTNLAKAQEEAKGANKFVLLDFTGSDWCPACMKLHKEVFEKSQFKEFAEKNLVLVLVDFPEKKELAPEQAAANDKLKDKYDIEGFPTLILLNGKGKKVMKQVGYDGSKPQEVIAKLEKAMKK